MFLRQALLVWLAFHPIQGKSDRNRHIFSMPPILVPKIGLRALKFFGFPALKLFSGILTTVFLLASLTLAWSLSPGTQFGSL